ncbi:MAG: YggS family pyridoxal phosphate-dependent enzyme [Chloroflexota bacterium]
MSHITRNVEDVLSSIPDTVCVTAAIKGRTLAQIREAVDAGIRVLGANYVGDARRARGVVGTGVECHFIGRMRAHDIRPGMIRLFDMMQSIGSLDIAERVDARCSALERPMPVLIEINSGREPQKSGVLPEQVPETIRQVSELENLRVEGLMTMGPFSANPEEYKPAFVETRRLFDSLEALSIPRVTMRYLSMGMSDSYRVAIDEGANMVRLGSILFDGPIR